MVSLTKLAAPVDGSIAIEWTDANVPFSKKRGSVAFITRRLAMGLSGVGRDVGNSRDPEISVGRGRSRFVRRGKGAKGDEYK